ncbi:MAG: hypothetical protein RLW62_21950 [Gammaproteobacteria bacterium]
MNDLPSRAAPPGVDWPARFVAHLGERYAGHVEAIVMYGSWLRGKRDTVLDFYVLLDAYAALGSRCAATANRLLPPNVYHVLLEGAGTSCAAKYATVTLDQFERAIAHDFNCYFWARFAQPAAVCYVRDEAIAQRLERCFERAAERMITATAPLLPPSFPTDALWSRAFTLTYGCELRSEDAVRAGALAETYAAHLHSRTTALAARNGLARDADGNWRQAPPATHTRAAAARAWRRRRRLGKLLSVARLLKAAFTFNDPLGYVVWKVARHSGVHVEPTPLQRRHPLLLGWPVLWRLYRRGGFR